LNVTVVGDEASRVARALKFFVLAENEVEDRKVVVAMPGNLHTADETYSAFKSAQLRPFIDRALTDSPDTASFRS